MQPSAALLVFFGLPVRTPAYSSETGDQEKPFPLGTYGNRVSSSFPADKILQDSNDDF